MKWVHVYLGKLTLRLPNGWGVVGSAPSDPNNTNVQHIRLGRADVQHTKQYFCFHFFLSRLLFILEFLPFDLADNGWNPRRSDPCPLWRPHAILPKSGHIPAELYKAYAPRAGTSVLTFTLHLTWNGQN